MANPFVTKTRTSSVHSSNLVSTPFSAAALSPDHQRHPLVGPSHRGRVGGFLRSRIICPAASPTLRERCESRLVQFRLTL